MVEWKDQRVNGSARSSASRPSGRGQSGLRGQSDLLLQELTFESDPIKIIPLRQNVAERVLNLTFEYDVMLYGNGVRESEAGTAGAGMGFHKLLIEVVIPIYGSIEWKHRGGLQTFGVRVRRFDRAEGS